MCLLFYKVCHSLGDLPVPEQRILFSKDFELDRYPFSSPETNERCCINRYGQRKEVCCQQYSHRQTESAGFLALLLGSVLLGFPPDSPHIKVTSIRTDARCFQQWQPMCEHCTQTNLKTRKLWQDSLWPRCNFSEAHIPCLVQWWKKPTLWVNVKYQHGEGPGLNRTVSHLCMQKLLSPYSEREVCILNHTVISVQPSNCALKRDKS